MDGTSSSVWMGQGWNGMGVGVGLGVTENKSKVVGGRIKIDWKRLGISGGVLVKYVGQYTIVSLYGGFARARVYVLWPY